MSKLQDADDPEPGPARSRLATAAAATTLAVLLLAGLGLPPAAAAPDAVAPQPGAAEESGPADPEVAQRLAGVAQELAEAVTRGEITESQAAAFLVQVHRRIAA